MRPFDLVKEAFIDNVHEGLTLWFMHRKITAGPSMMKRLHLSHIISLDTMPLHAIVTCLPTHPTRYGEMMAHFIYHRFVHSPFFFKLNACMLTAV